MAQTYCKLFYSLAGFVMGKLFYLDLPKLKIMRVFFFAVLLLTITGCKQQPKDFDYGKIENGVYTNNYFDFEIPVPANWAVQNKEQVQQLQKTGEELVSGNDKELGAKIKAANVRTAILLTVFKNKTDTITDKFNSSFIILSENLGGMPVKKGSEYLAHAKEIMQQSNMSYQFAPNYSTEKIGNKEFDRMDVALGGQGQNVQQSYYSAIDKDFALSIIISYGDEEQRAELKNIVNKIKFR
jgi:hypothetical protein